MIFKIMKYLEMFYDWFPELRYLIFYLLSYVVVCFFYSEIFINSFKAPDSIYYFVVSTSLLFLGAGSYDWLLEDGRFDCYLVRPISFLKYWILNSFVAYFFESIMAFTVLCLFFGIPKFWYLYPLTFIMAFIGSFLIYFTVSSLFFFIGRVHFIYTLIWSFKMISTILPLNYLPEPFKTILSLNPGNLIIYYPSLITVNGKFSLEWLIGVILLSIICYVVYTKGIEKYTVFGG